MNYLPNKQLDLELFKSIMYSNSCLTVQYSKHWAGWKHEEYVKKLQKLTFPIYMFIAASSACACFKPVNL